MTNHIVDRLARMKEKQMTYRLIVRGIGRNSDYATKKRIADIVCLHRYAGWTKARLARHYGVSPNRVNQIIARFGGKTKITVCHPRGICSGQLARVFPAYCQPAATEAQDDDEYSFGKRNATVIQ